jgi:serine/threonine protein kinase
LKSPPSHDIGHYRVETRIGEGGMGVVYRALDTKLHRPVAIKFLSDELADAAARRRFQREAQTASSLNHPHIVTVYDVGEIGGRQYLVTEYIDGGTLRDWARRQKRSWRDIVELLKGVADGLATAHEANILHRDIKPANILITKSGYAKVADFGLATLAEDADANVTPTLTEDATARGAVIGTIAYMSPEQAVGQKLDARSDVFSFGAVLYELLGGKRPFEGSTDLELLQNVIKAEPPPLADDVSLRLRMVVEKALAKNPAERYQSMRELAVDLRRLLHQSAEQPGIVIPPRPRGRWWPWAAAAFLLAVAYVFVQTRGTTEVPEPLTAAAFTSLPGLERYPSFSPDGDRVAFMWTGTTQDNPDIYVQQVGAGGHVQLTFDPRSDFNPAWSPDGRWIAFLRGDTPALQMRGRFEVRLIPPLGGRDIKLAEIRVQMNYLSPVSNLTWCADSTCVIVTHSQREGDADALFVVPLDGGEMTQLTNPPPSIAGGDNDASMSPDGALLVFRRTGNVPVGELWLLPLDVGVRAKGGPRRLGPGRYPAWMPGAREILFAAPGGLWRLSATDETAKPSRLPFVGDDGMMPAVSRPSRGMQPRLVYARRLEDYNIWRVGIPRPGAPSAPARFDAISSTRSDKVPQPLA